MQNRAMRTILENQVAQSQNPLEENWEKKERFQNWNQNLNIISEK